MELRQQQIREWAEAAAQQGKKLWHSISKRWQTQNTPSTPSDYSETSLNHKIEAE
jgi:hypothetical protein